MLGLVPKGVWYMECEGGGFGSLHVTDYRVAGFVMMVNHRSLCDSVAN